MLCAEKRYGGTGYLENRFLENEPLRDRQNKLENVVEVEFKSKYNGFKLIPGDVVYAGDLIRDYNYDPLIVIRKNIWKSLFSKIGAVYISNDEKTIDAYTKSSKNTKTKRDNRAQREPGPGRG